MKKLISSLFFLAFAFSSFAQAFMATGNWKKWESDNIPASGVRTLIPDRETIFFINSGALKNKLFSLSSDPEEGSVIDLPAPDGTIKHFTVWQDNMMEGGLAEKYPNIRTFSGYAADNRGTTIKLDYNDFGFHAMIFDPSGIYFIDPYSSIDNGFYSCYYRKDYTKPIGQTTHCEVDGNTEDAASLTDSAPVKLRVNGTVKRTFRLALACTGEYAVAVAGPNPTKSAVLSKMITSMNRVNGVYERELAVHMDLIANNDTLIFLDGTTDPYSNNSSGGTLLSENPGVVNSRVGLANYDIGHVFSTGGGGIATGGSVCKNAKAQGVTGQSNPQGDPFDIDYVCHEMGHQFDADHTFNANTGSCGGGNGVQSTAYEPGSGSTIMAYAGICGSTNNLQANSDAYFHAISLEQIHKFLVASNGATCATATSLSNNPPSVPAFTQSHIIPVSTSFELIAPTVIDTDHDTLTYCWEQWNRGNFGAGIGQLTRGPIFRSFQPDTSRIRVFPMTDINGNLRKGEMLPGIERFLTFKLTVRDIFNGFGSFNFPDDTVHIDITTLAGPFEVTSPATAVNWLGSTLETVTWDVANTDLAPVNCANVDILLSLDGGASFPYVLAQNTANDGSETITVPNVSSTTQARVKVKAVGNVFFDINPVNFIITQNTGIKNVSWQNGLSIFPVPASDMLHIMSTNGSELEISVVNTVGQKILHAMLTRKLDIPVNTWSRGIYYIQFSNPQTGEKVIRSVVIN